MRGCFALLLLTLAPGITGAADVGAPESCRWIWHPEIQRDLKAPAATRYFRKAFEIPADAKVRAARLFHNCDDGGNVYVNGARLGHKSSGWPQIEMLHVKQQLRPGKNVLVFDVSNGLVGPAGLMAWLVVDFENHPSLRLVTDASWKVSVEGARGWQTVTFEEKGWVAAKELGPITMAPWGRELRAAVVLPVPTPPRTSAQRLTPEETRKMIEADWVYQAGDDTTPAQSLREVQWARKMAARFMGHERRPDLGTELAKLNELERSLTKLKPDQNDAIARELFLAVRRVKRDITFKNPLLDFSQILLVESPPYSGKHESAHRNGYYYGNNSGGRLMVLDGLRPDALERDLIPPDGGFLMRMDLSADARRVVFSMRPQGEQSFHLYEVGIDGKGQRQLTSSPYDDMDPIYLPGGQILFSTSRGNSYVRCLPPSASTVLARCDADGKNVYIISRNNEPDYTPALMPDGRVLYTRWEYTERPLWRLQKLWTINPDGTGEAVFWGNGSAYPDMLWEARPVPGTRRVMFAGVGHHNVVTGCLGLVDPERGREYPNGIWKITTELRWPEVGDGPELCAPASPDYHGGHFYSYRCPLPLGPEDFLVSAAQSENSPFELYLMDIHGNRELIYAGCRNILYAQPVRAREVPASVPDRTVWPKADEAPAPGVFFSPNVYDGADGLPAGSAKYLRVIQMDAKTYSMPFKSWRHSGPVISVIQEDGVKRILGTVPIQPDGSVAFRVPSGRALHFQLLDENQRCIQIMRSFTGVMPGETRGCLGCHGQHSVSPQSSGNPAAMRQAPADLTPPPWGTAVSVSYERFCQPILDKYCGQCHQGNGEARAKLDLTLRGGEPERGVTDPKLLPFKEPYLTLVGPAWNSPLKAKGTPGFGMAGCLNVEVDLNYGPLRPFSMLSSTSPLIKMAMSGAHYNVKVEGEDLQKLIAWVDCNCVYRGEEEVRQIPDPVDPKARPLPVPFRTRTAPVIERLHPVTDAIPSRK